MAINRAQLARQLEPGLNTVFGLEYNRYPEEWKNIFEIESSNRAFEEDQLMMGFGPAQLKAEGAGISFDSTSELWTARYTMVNIATGFSITEEAQDDNLYGNVGKKLARAMARSLQHSKEIRGANVLNNGFDSNFVGGDGKQLFATDHPLGKGGTLSNTLSTPADLSEAAIEDATIAIAGFVDDAGLPVMVMPKRLIVPKELNYEAQRILYSNGRVGTPDNDLNAIKELSAIPEGYSLNHYLTDPDAWFIITDCPDGLKHFKRMPVRTMTQGEFNTGNILYKGQERYAFGWTDPRCAYGSAGA
jgi:Mu-like prophage major head subunit gpT